MKRVRPLLGNRLNLTNNKLVDVNLACRKFGFQILQDGEFIMYEGFLIIYFYFFLSLSLKLDNLELKAVEMKKKRPAWSTGHVSLISELCCYSIFH